MAEYIEREAALSLVRPDTPEDEKAAITIVTAKKLVRSIVRRTPAADVAPVVHCKDCAHRTEMGNCGHPRYHGILPSAYPYDFCSYGARMDGGACNQVCKYNTPDRGCVAGELRARCDLENVAGERGNGETG